MVLVIKIILMVDKNRKKYFSYMRVSASSYEVSSIKTQNDLIMKRVDEMNKSDYNISRDNLIPIKEKASASSTKKRPNFEGMMKVLEKDVKKPHEKREYGGIFFFKIDRLARNDEDFTRLSNLLKAWYIFFSVTETIENTPTGRLLFRILSSFAVYESEKLSNRITYAQIHHFLQKEYWKLGGSLCFGYRKKQWKWWSWKIEVSSKDKEVLEHIYSLYLEWKKVKEITLIVNKKSYLTTYILNKNKTIEKKKKELEIKEQGLNEVKSLTESDNTEENYSLEESNLSKENDELVEVHGYSKEESLVYRILRNYKLNAIKYNGYFRRNFSIPDELIKDYVRLIISKSEEYDWLSFEGIDIPEDVVVSISSKIPFVFFDDSFKIVNDHTYNKVKERVLQEDRVMNRNHKELEQLKLESLFHPIFKFSNSASRYSSLWVEKKSNNIQYSCTIPWGNISEKKVEQALSCCSSIKKIFRPLSSKDKMLLEKVFFNVSKNFYKKEKDQLSSHLLILNRSIKNVQFEVDAIKNFSAEEIKLSKERLNELRKDYDLYTSKLEKIQKDQESWFDFLLSFFEYKIFDLSNQQRKRWYKFFFKRIELVVETQTNSKKGKYKKSLVVSLHSYIQYRCKLPQKITISLT